jgi:hypothetical protein
VAPRGQLLRRGYLTSSRVGLGLTALPLNPMAVDPLNLACWSLSLGDVEVF